MRKKEDRQGCVPSLSPDSSILTPPSPPWRNRQRTWLLTRRRGFESSRRHRELEIE